MISSGLTAKSCLPEMSRALQPTSSIVCRVKLCTSWKTSRRASYQRDWSKGLRPLCSILARMQHFHWEARRWSHQDPLQGKQQHPGPSSAWRYSFNPKTIFKPRLVPRKKKQTTRCEGTDSPGAHQMMWWERDSGEGQKRGSGNTGRSKKINEV